ncbi:thioredoxin family protein [Streptococcus mutans]|uniref:thioredoxin family protein n=1 Tax=Streptococcus mutans TaxID=1309 RepID=UPI00081BC9AC|nr:thioredoxin family protein [Streptococcus mutans]AYO48781.1 thiol reductase thioredoxin [Streptococcus mutans]MCB5002906.1 thioredoxin family protein [Streptococcus mutans]MCB5014863.1 thioredoxin family protein [Streptococcus mutans]MCB5069075.1 thioredoxin family protein [Streptococcus mutans]MCB5072538.1 thioredoxin family protein [Streptococcus mutans]
MKYYKTLLLCSASLLLLAAGVAYAEEETPQGIEKTEVSASAVTTETQSADATVVQETVAPAATTASTVTSSENKSERSDENSVRETSLETSDQVIENSQPPQQEVDTSSSTEKTSDSKNTVSEGVSVEEYEANVANFKAVSMADVYHMFDDTENSYTLYIGRPTCHYCRDFSPVLKEFNGLTGSQLYYYNTDRDDFTVAAKEFLTKKVGMFATPTTLYIDKGQLISGWVGSGIPSKELYNKLYSNSNYKEELKSGNQTSALKDTPIADKENTTNPTEQVKTVPGSGKPVPRQKSAQSAVSATKKSDSSQMTDEEADKKPVTKVITAFLSFLYDALAKLKI